MRFPVALVAQDRYTFPTFPQLAPWCNWQHKGFWFLYSRFES